MYMFPCSNVLGWKSIETRGNVVLSLVLAHLSETVRKLWAQAEDDILCKIQTFFQQQQQQKVTAVISFCIPTTCKQLPAAIHALLSFLSFLSFLIFSLIVLL